MQSQLTLFLSLQMPQSNKLDTTLLMTMVGETATMDVSHDDGGAVVMSGIAPVMALLRLIQHAFFS